MTIKSISAVSAELRADIIAALVAENAPAHQVIGEQFGVAKGVVRMIDLKRKSAANEEKAAAAEVAEAASDVAGVVAEATTGDAAPVAQTRASKLAALKAQVGEADATDATDTDKPKRARAKREAVDTTTRDVIVASSVTAGVAWMSGNIGYKGKDDAWVTGDLLKTAKGRKGTASDNLAALAEADDLVIERNIDVLLEDHEAIMAGHWDRLEGEGRTMIGRRPKGFKKVAAPRPKKVQAADDESVDDLDAKIAALMAKKAKAAEPKVVDAVDATDVVEATQPSHYAPVTAPTTQDEQAEA